MNIYIQKYQWKHSQKHAVSKLSCQSFIPTFGPAGIVIWSLWKCGTVSDGVRLLVNLNQSCFSKVRAFLAFSDAKGGIRDILHAKHAYYHQVMGHQFGLSNRETLQRKSHCYYHYCSRWPCDWTSPSTHTHKSVHEIDVNSCSTW